MVAASPGPSLGALPGDLLATARDRCRVGAMQRAEIVFFMRSAEEESTMLLSQCRTEPLDQRVVDEAASIYRRWSPSHGVDVNDALLAATARRTEGRIDHSLNTKRYPMPGVQVSKAW